MPSQAEAEGFRTEFAVSMECEACVQDIRRALQDQEGLMAFDIDLEEQRVVVQGLAPPSRISRALKESGRQVIVRGTGTASGTHAGAAVCIFEAYTPPTSAAFDPEGPSQKVHGIARMVQTKESDDGVCIVDLTIRHDALAESAERKGATSRALAEAQSAEAFRPSLQNGEGASGGEEAKRFTVYVAQSGDISEGAKSAGGIQQVLGEIEVNPDTGYGDMFIEVPRLKVWEMIGHAMVIAPVWGGGRTGEGILAGVIARSAGAWGNDKKVCACSGQTMWEENRLNLQGKL